MGYEPPAHRRSCIALIVAPTVASITFGIGVALLEPGSPGDLLGMALLMTVYGSIFGAFPAAVFLGLPVYFALRGRVRATPLTCGVAGGVVGLAPGLLWHMAGIPGALVLGIASGIVGGISFWWVAKSEVNRDLQ